MLLYKDHMTYISLLSLYSSLFDNYPKCLAVFRRYIASQTIPCCAGSGHKEAHATLMEDARCFDHACFNVETQ